MHYLLSMLFVALFSVSAHADGFPYSNFFKLKTEVKEIIAEVAIDHSNNKLTLELLSSVMSETVERLNALRSKGDLPFEYSCKVDFDKNVMHDIAEGFGSVTTIIQYSDQAGNIAWEFKTVYSPQDLTVYSTLYEKNNKDKGIDDYQALFSIPLKKSNYELDFH